MEQQWWHKSVIYQVYPKSFYDADGDGNGDIRGIIEKLDYLQELGVDIIWMCPINQSPMDDNGYDISDYYEIAPEFGTIQEFETLIEEAQKRNIQIMMDLVINHTSDEHPWFVESRKSADNPYSDYYIWRDPKEGETGPKEPNNWASYFSGSAWEFDSNRQQYYLHLYSKKQPDLNWEHPKVRKEMQDVIRFWIEKGVKGFRMDVINKLSKDQRFPDVPNVPEGEYALGRPYYLDGPRIHEFLREVAAVYEGKEIVTVGETSGVTVENARLYTNPARKELDMVFQFDHMAVDAGPYPVGKWEVKPVDFLALKRIMSHWQDGLYGIGWNSLYWSNHDQPRAVSRFGDDREPYRELSAKMLGTCLHFMQGTPYVYQGEEIGMTNVQFESLDEYQDIELLNMYKERRAKGVSHDELMRAIWAKGRDNARTPMQWDDTGHGGFSKAEQTWLKVNPNYKAINVKAQLEDPESVFHYYKSLIQLRKDSPVSDVMVYGKYQLLLAEHEGVYAYTRTFETDTLLVLCNFQDDTYSLALDEVHTLQGAAPIIGNYSAPQLEGETIVLRPYEALVLQLT
ncbi:glycoside hydrolase family 13 protein [Marinicrinis sediminis]|uniref:oligo-1,6-glucosidase n=1 Tax=Marinicrinis sediminis TaxID=1652465 RepID=A0ABW5R5Z3_9BACL